MCAMFQQPIRPQGEVHVEFRAGKMDWDGRMVKPDKRKGKIVLYTAEDEQLMHFQWHDREKNEVGLDLIVINDAYLERIEKCKTGRVYLLRFTSSDKKHFFWIQEPKEEGDNDLIKRFNEAIGATRPEKSGAAAAPGGATAPSPTPGAAPAQATGDVDPQLRFFMQQFLEGAAAQGQPRAPPVSLNSVLTTEVLQSTLTDDAAVAEMATLLPEGQRTPEDLKEALASPQLQQSLQALTQAIHSDQLPVLFASLGLNPAEIATIAPGADALEVLCRAMEASEGGASGSPPPSAPGDGAGAPPS